MKATMVIFLLTVGSLGTAKASYSHANYIRSVIINNYSSTNPECRLTSLQQKKIVATNPQIKSDNDFEGAEKEAYTTGKYKNTHTVYDYDVEENSIGHRNILSEVYDCGEVCENGYTVIYPSDRSGFTVRGTPGCSEKFVELTNRATVIGSEGYFTATAEDIKVVVDPEKASRQLKIMSEVAQELCDGINGVKNNQSKILVSNQSTEIPRKERASFFSKKSVNFLVKIRCYLNE